MTITRAWWIVAVGMIVAVPGAIAVAVINRESGPSLRHVLRYAPHGLFYLGLAIAALGTVQVVRVATRALR